MTDALRVVLADDDSLIRTAIDAILRPVADIDLIGQAADGRAAIDLATRHRPDVVLLDIQMPVLDGLAALREIRRLVPTAQIVVLTTFGEDEYVTQALTAGAAGFRLKDSAAGELPNAIRAAAAGDAFLSPKVTRQVLKRLPATPPATPEDLTKIATLSTREREILVLLARPVECGDRRAPVGDRGHGEDPRLPPLRAKLDCDNRVKAAMLAQRAGLLDEPAP